MFGGLLEINSSEEFNNFIDGLDKNDAIRLIETALTYCQQNGMFTFEESHTIYKSLKKLRENDDE